jgi:hypothetical protein
VLVPLTPADYDLLKENLKRYQGSRQIPVTIRVQGRAGATWTGHVRTGDLPQAEAKEIPLALSSRGGGPLAVKPNNDPNKLEPQAQVYLVGVNFDQSDEAITSGGRAQVKIHCDYRSLAWWTWRALSQTFDIGLAF